MMQSLLTLGRMSSDHSSWAEETRGASINIHIFLFVSFAREAVHYGQQEPTDRRSKKYLPVKVGVGQTLIGNEDCLASFVI